MKIETRTRFAALTLEGEIYTFHSNSNDIYDSMWKRPSTVEGKITGWIESLEVWEEEARNSTYSNAEQLAYALKCADEYKLGLEKLRALKVVKLELTVNVVA
jgi:hypothetical protein